VEEAQNIQADPRQRPQSALRRGSRASHAGATIGNPRVGGSSDGWGSAIPTLMGNEFSWLITSTITCYQRLNVHTHITCESKTYWCCCIKKQAVHLLTQNVFTVGHLPRSVYRKNHQTIVIPSYATRHLSAKTYSPYYSSTL